MFNGHVNMEAELTINGFNIRTPVLMEVWYFYHLESQGVFYFTKGFPETGYHDTYYGNASGFCGFLPDGVLPIPMSADMALMLGWVTLSDVARELPLSDLVKAALTMAVEVEGESTDGKS